MKTKQGGGVTGNRRQGERSTWPTKTKTKPCAQTQDKQGYIKQRQNRHGCQGRTLTVPPLQASTLGEGILGRTGLIKDKGGTNWGAGGEERLEVQYSQETQGVGLGGQKIVQGNILELPKKVVS